MREHEFEVLLVGDSQVGKSSLVERNNVFIESSYFPTLGVDFVVKRLALGEDKVSLKIWDASGDERFQYLLRAYNERADALVVCFDINRRESFDHLDTWLERSPRRGRPLFFVGTKSDRPRAVSHEEIANAAGVHGAVYMETSSKTGVNVHQVPLLIARTLLNRVPKPREPPLPQSPCCFQ